MKSAIARAFAVRPDPEGNHTAGNGGENEN